VTVYAQVSEEVADALAGHRPVVALETTLVSHGFSGGRGLTVAVESERRVRAAGAVPATAGILDGAIHIGLTPAELERFAAAGLSARKVGARDLAATAELLETLGIPVLGWRTTTLPRFYTAEGGPPVSATVSDSPEAARICAAHWELNGGGGMLLARPPVGGIDIDPLIDQAVERVSREHRSGQAVTPAVLALLDELSDGRSVEVNRRLIEDNAGLAGEVAVAYSQLKQA
jgi:pseudouridine-5'-phosphate glycosidase